MNYKVRLFVWFLMIFALFTAAIVAYQLWRDKTYRIEMLSSTLDTYSYVAERDSTLNHIGDKVRVTSIDKSGKLLYDNNLDSSAVVENHLLRPEIVGAKKYGSAHDIRTSATTLTSYFYYARRTPTGYIRMAMPYDDKTQALLRPDRAFLLFVLLLSVVSIAILWRVARRFGSDLESLKANLIDQSAEKAALKTEMTSAIAHELRTPISAIRAYAETLRLSDITPAQRDQFIERIDTASIRLSDLLQDVSLLSKMEEAPDKFTSELLDIHALFDQISSELSVETERRSIKMINRIPVGMSVNGNRTLLYTIFRNLLENAVKYSGNWTQITAQITQITDQQVHIRIWDTGVGIDPAHIKRIFERFYRANQGRSRDDGGSGLGLSIVAHAVAHHRGTIEAVNLPDGGVAFDFTLNR